MIARDIPTERGAFEAWLLEQARADRERRPTRRRRIPTAAWLTATMILLSIIVLGVCLFVADLQAECDLRVTTIQGCD